MDESFGGSVVNLARMTQEEKKLFLFNKQKETLDQLCEHGAISQMQHDKSLSDLIAKMGIGE